MNRTSLGEVEGDAIAVQFTPAKIILDEIAPTSARHRVR